MASEDIALEHRFNSCMVLSGVGDALGYKDAAFEFCRSGKLIQESVVSLGGLSAMVPSPSKITVSDDTVMHLATAEALVSDFGSHTELYLELAREYKLCMKDMAGRAPGGTCKSSAMMLNPEVQNGFVIPFNPRGGGCGAAMRAVPIGLLYWRPEEVGSLVRVAIEAGRMTHNHPTGFLGSVAVALFVSYAVQGKEVREWGEGLLQTLHTAKLYCEQQKRDWESIRDSWSYFEDQWRSFLSKIGLLSPILDTGATDSIDLSSDLDAPQYDKFVKSLSMSGTGGASGHDAPMIAYSAILRCYIVEDPPSRWEKLCRYGMFHGGDSDSTGIIAGACYGAMFGLEGVPTNNYTQLEYRDRLEKLAKQLFSKNQSETKESAKAIPADKEAQPSVPEGMDAQSLSSKQKNS